MVDQVSATSTIRIGSRVYLRNAIAGEPGCVRSIDSRGFAHVEWVDMPELGRFTKHRIDTLEIDSAFVVKQLGLDFGELAA